RFARVAIVIAALVLLLAPDAGADWLFTPFLGATFAPRTPFFDLEQSARTTKVVVGGAAAPVRGGVLGGEAEFGYSPRFFERGSRSLITGSNVTTILGNVVVALPVSVTRE